MRNQVTVKQEEEEEERPMVERDPINGAKAMPGWYEENTLGKKIYTNAEKMKSLDFPCVPPVGYEACIIKCGDGKSFREYGEEPKNENHANGGDHVVLRMKKKGEVGGKSRKLESQVIDDESEVEKKNEWEEDDDGEYREEKGRKYPYALKKGLEGRYLVPDVENGICGWKECTVCFYDEEVKKVRVAPAKRNGEKSIAVNLSDYQDKFDTWVKAEADTKMITMDMIRNAMNEELQNHAKGIDQAYHELAKALPLEIRERIGETRRQIVDSVMDETGSREYALEKEFASWTELIWSIAASNSSEQPAKLAAKLIRCMSDEEE